MPSEVRCAVRHKHRSGNLGLIFGISEDNVNAEQDSEILAETDNLIAWRSRDESGYIYHLELGTLSLHLMPEEWDEFVVLVKNAALN